MKQLYLFGVVPTLMLMAALGTANAKLVTGDDPSFTAAAEVTAAPGSAAPTSSLPGEVLVPDAFRDSEKLLPDGHVNGRNYGELPARTHDNPHMDLWLLLLVAAVAGVVSEVYHRRSCNR